jgi:hypothetical protein
MTLKTEIAEGQAYFDAPVYVEVSRAKPIALAINAMRSPDDTSPVILPYIETLSHYERTRLRWMKPDGRGGLKPKGKR